MQKLQEWLQDVLQHATHWIVIIMLPQGLKPLPDLLQLGTRTCVHGGGEEDAEQGCKSKRPCRPDSLHINGAKLNGVSGLYSVLDPPSPSSSSSEEDDSPTPSPIDFTKVDPTLYDYDTRTNLPLPEEEKALQAAVSKAAVQNGYVDHSESRRTVSSIRSLQDGEGPTEFLDDIDHIVSLLMTWHHRLPLSKVAFECLPQLCLLSTSLSIITITVSIPSPPWVAEMFLPTQFTSDIL